MLTIAQVLRRICTHPLNRKSPEAALWRFVSWQIRSRVSRKPIITDWIGTAKLQAKNGDSGVTGNFYNGLQEFEDMSFLLHVLRPHDVFVDVGANAGAWTVLASKVIGARAAAFEPVPEAFERLSANIQLNGLADLVKAYNVGLSENAGVLEFSADKDSMNHVVHDNEKKTSCLMLPVDSLDNVIQERISLVKIDVEGFEVPVLKGAERHLDDEHLLAVIVETNESGRAYGFSNEEICKQLRAFGYQPFAYDPWNRELTAIPQHATLSGNTIFIRQIAQVEGRLKHGEPVLVNGTEL